MNDTRFKSPRFRPSFRARSARAVLIVAVTLGAIGLWALNWGCADPRKEPLAPAEPGYTETIDLWNFAATDANGLASAPFTVAQPLAPIQVPGVDSPARLVVAAFIVPDCQIYKRLELINDSIPYVRDSLIIDTLVQLTNVKGNVDTTHSHAVDSLEGVLRNLVASAIGVVNLNDSALQVIYHGRTVPCDTALYSVVFIQPEHQDSVLASVGAAISTFNDTLARLEVNYTRLELDTLLMGMEAIYLGNLLDQRYEMSIALDSTNTFYFPNANYIDNIGNPTGQGIYAAAIDTTTGMIGRGFTLALDRMQAADINHLGHTFEVNLAVCFVGSNRPCLEPGSHTVYVRLPGRNARVTGTIVLVYAQRT